ncbi:AI-2E family transporter [Methylobacterium sp. J-068]|uniref:AI-2E family transporter n=1 Tax=Methylobacterium sp. J-068 TaxID=2836649 RepID=UPI001FBAF4AB|nr:AI-2E family transporter [Methylobacterium sp. J-068]MCJ2035830.1 AI-2E family transporter [Methylobacterium sp. J-068]
MAQDPNPKRPPAEPFVAPMPGAERAPAHASPNPPPSHAPGPLSGQGQGLARVVLVVALSALGLWVLHPFVPALVWAVILAIALGPLYARAERRWPPGGHNIALPALFTAAVALVFLVPLVVLGVQAAREAHDVAAWMRSFEKTGIPVPDLLARLPFGAAQAQAWWAENLSHPAAGSELLHRFDNSSVLGVTRSLGAQIVRRTVLFGFTLVALFFLFRDGRAVAAQVLTASAKLFGPRGERVARQMVASVHGTVDGLVLVGLGEGVLLGIVYYFAGVPHPVLLGALTAVAAMIPFGAPLVFGAAALVLLANGAVVPALVVVAAGLVVTFIADHFVRPALIGGTTRLPFLWVLLGILGGVESFGLLGLFLGPAVMAALILLWREFTQGADPRA